MPDLGFLYVRIGAKTDELDEGQKRARKSLEDLGASMRRAVNDAAKLGVAAGAAGAAILSGIVVSSARGADEIRRLAELSGTTAREFQRNAAAARRFGIEGDKLADIYKDMQDRVGDFMHTGGGPLLDFFEQVAPKIGVTADQFRALSGPDALQLYVNSLERANLSQADMVFYLEAVAGDASRLLPLLRDNGELMREFGDEAERVGAVLSNVEVEQLAAVNRSLETIRETVTGVKNQIAVALGPVVGELAERFRALSVQNSGFREQIQRVIETGIRGFGKFLDVLQGMRVAGKAAELVFVGFRATVVSVAQIAGEAVSRLIDEVIEKANAGIDALNRLPKIDIARIDPVSDSAFMETLREMGETARRSVGEVRAELHELAMQELPSEKFERFLATVRDRAEETAAAAADAREQLRLETLGGDTSVGAVGSGEEDEAERKRQEAALERLRERVMTEAEILAKRHAEELEELAAHNEAKRLLDEEYYALRTELEAKHQEEMRELRERAMTDAERFEAMSLRGRIATVTAGLARMTAGVAQHNEKLFRLNQAAALAEAAIALPKAILDSYKNAGGYPWGIAPAAAMAATGAAQIQAIRSATFAGGGGGVAPSAAGTTAAPATSDIGAGQGGGGIRERVFRVQGISPTELFSGSAVRGLLEALQEAIDDGGRLVFD